MNKKRVKMADIVRTTRPTHSVDPERKASFLVENKHVQESKNKKHEDKILNELSKKVEYFEKEEVDVFNKEDAHRKKRFFSLRKPKWKTFILLILILILIGGGAYCAVTFLPRAEIKIITEKSNWEYNDSVIASKKISGVDLAGKKIPAEVFSQKKNNNLLFPATGTKDVKQKAIGKIIIYNAYSSESQLLIANTRFLAPDGKIFRLTNKIIVPGAKIVEGKIISSSIEAGVMADAAGEEYNIKPVEYFSIPGFKDSAKYKGFYAESKNSMTGGFIGKMAVPTDENIKQAKEKNRQILQQALNSFIYSQIPEGFKIIEGAEQFNIIKETVNKETDAVGNFAVFGEAELSITAFKEEDAKNLIVSLAKGELGKEFEPKEYQLNYGISRADINNGSISFPVDFQGVFWQAIDIGTFRESIKNKSESELRGAVFSLPKVEKVEVSFWPFWVNQVPDNTDRIKVVIE
ncbi:MAG: hypothetical protein AAB516_00340 [Patescibacteria group bacterium]